MKSYHAIAGLLGVFSWWNFGSNNDTETQKEPAPEIVETPIVPVLEEYNPKTHPFSHAPDGLSINEQQAGECASCHADIFEQWYQSPHRNGILSQSLLKEWSAHNNAPDCQNCHLPLVTQRPFVASTYVNGDPLQPILDSNPRFESSLYSESVGCVACHMRDGQIVGQNSVAAPHSLLHSPTLSNSSACQNCHQGQPAGYSEPIYTTVSEWQKSSFAKAGVHCQDCHMSSVPSTNSLVGRLTQSNHQVSLNARQALTVRLGHAPSRVQRGTVEMYQVSIVNSGAGHALPTGSPFQNTQIVFQVIRGDSNLQEPITHDLNVEFSTESPKQILKDSRIPADGVVSFQIPIEINQKKEPGLSVFTIFYVEDGERTSLLEYPIEIR